MAGRLQGKIALVTGIGAGIGQGIALRFAREGAIVVGCDISAQWAEATVKQAADEGLAIDSVHPVDLTRPDDVGRFIDHAGATYGHIDILVNAAAIAPHMAPVATMDYEREWMPTMVGEVDLVFLAVKAAWPHMVKVGGGSIINFASVNAMRGSTNTGMIAHCAGKAAVMAMSRQIAIEGGPHGIRCNTIAPGMVQTAATAAAGTSSGAVAERILQRLVIKRLGVPDDIAWAAVFLASDESTWVTGANFPVDGGVTAA
ncbi:NAD(P)-dependent dehydrogenase (short-subunit alcohol dehydrogenase family) [Novosphingobium sp. SG751A]|uniref:SDR family NAD(P)-dependent oxidoreductase n=1 Tax=Novosphingobium sp. SG751A TaxID=2587000 RepID=UPI001555BAF7|nr:SDR family oxidoreductase [Novosphingobium sp. SG751A]NOW44740.1 NAD(P)-dependent dehydrogenase (short-subunit alcohol dehydrogenase family) [Novosphingobium sp. SG751A]